MRRPRGILLWSRTLEAGSASPELWRLDASELSRLGRLPAEADRLRFVTARLLLRGACRIQLGRRAGGVRLRETSGPAGRGKPRLEGPGLDAPGAPGWDVSISHSGDAVLVGLAAAPIGVDLQPLADAPRVRAVRVFTDREARWLRTHRGDYAALRLWTAKEALLKAKGTGFAANPRGGENDVFESGAAIACFAPLPGLAASVALLAAVPVEWPAGLTPLAGPAPANRPR
ncbi:MAG: 4'-phosphopantetheinyl transferase superfamily protein [Bifidobacteriaceae bacterium]|nr:4'-phosphopantetheinyl transferase superfamily protein [Bifidobacteriaceae bacterium]